MRTAGVTATVAVLVLALGGCVVFKGDPSAEQEGTVGDVGVTLTICASGSSDCSGKGNSGLNAVSSPREVQVALGFRLPTTVSVPNSFSSTDGTATFTKSSAYTSALDQNYMAGPGLQWVGYTATSTYTSSSPQELTVGPRFTLQRQEDGSPFDGPFTYRPVIGFRFLSSTQTADSSFHCDYTDTSDPNYTICIDDPSTSDLSSDFALLTRDFGILSGASTTAASNSTASLPFTTEFDGIATSSTVFALSASSTVPGSSATPSVSSLAPLTNGTDTVPVSIGIPAGTAEGNYSVTLTATSPTGETRTQTGTVVVSNSAVTIVGGGGSTTSTQSTDTDGSSGGGSDSSGDSSSNKPVLSLSVTKKARASSLRRNGLITRVRSSLSTFATLKLRRKGSSRTLVRKVLKLKAKKARRVRLRSKKLRSGTYYVTLSADGVKVTRKLKLS